MTVAVHGRAASRVCPSGRGVRLYHRWGLVPALDGLPCADWSVNCSTVNVEIHDILIATIRLLLKEGAANTADPLELHKNDR